MMYRQVLSNIDIVNEDGSVENLGLKFGKGNNQKQNKNYWK